MTDVDESQIPLAPFQAIERSKIYATVVDRISDSIAAGRFVPGSALPSERALATQLGVSRGSLREALRVLEHTGVLEARPGSGTFVSSAGSSNSSLLRARAVAVGEHSPLDLIVARAAVEPVCAEQAAAARTQRDLDEIRRCLDEQIQLTHLGADATEADNAFHIAIAAASRNSVLVAMEETMVGLMHQQMWTQLKKRSRQQWGQEFIEHHELIYRAIENGDGRRAGQVMAMHIAAIETALVVEANQV